ncbi:MAG: hypothetical protein JO023_16910 [Chloroflexi bacterium]|nr:hypothetical protein [Chloroflexota bacterium]
MADWTGWQLLDGGYAGGVSDLGPNADGRLEIFGLRPAPGGQAVSTNFQTTANGGWNGWVDLGAPPQNDVLSWLRVASNADGRLEAFLRYGAMSTGVVWTAFQTAPNGSWSGWVSLDVGVGHVTSGVYAIVPNADGRLELFATAPGTPGGLVHAWQTAPNGSWSPEASLGTPSSVSILNQPAAGRNADGRLSAFMLGGDGAIWRIDQTAPNAGWGGWTSLGKPADTLSFPTLGTNADGRLELFAVGVGQGVWHTWQNAASSGSWSSWSNLGWPSAGVSVNDLAVGANADGRLELFGSDPSGEVWHVWQTAPNSGWSSWASLGGEPFSAPLVGRNQDGRLELFVEGRTAGSPPAASGVWHRWQTSPCGAWS